MKLFKILVVAAILTAGALIVYNAMNSKNESVLYETHQDGYIQCTYVDGAVFDLPGALEKVYTDNGLAMRSDAQLSYQDKSFTIIAVKGTKFLQYEDCQSAFARLLLRQTRIIPDADPKESEGRVEGRLKRMTRAIASVSINPQISGNYAGYWTAVSDGSDEWAMFVGYRADSYADLSNEQKRDVEHVAQTLTTAPHRQEDNNSNLFSTYGRTSSPDDPLALNEQGLCYEYGANGAVAVGVSVNKIYTRNEAKQKTDIFGAEPAPDGTRWQVAEFTSTMSPDEYETYCELRGLDGNNLVYSGVINPTRTHVVNDFVEKTENGYGRYFVYYAVPNGCSEYLLVFGNDEVGCRAYVKITN